MNSHQVVNELSLVHADGLRYYSDQENELWSWGAGLAPAFQAQASSVWVEERSQFIYGPGQPSEDIQRLTVLDLFARENRDDPYIPSQVQEFYRNIQTNPCCDATAMQTFPFSPAVAGHQRRASPIETITSNSSGVEDHSGYFESYPKSESDSLASPQSLLTPYELGTNFQGYSFHHPENGFPWGSDPYCALREVQHFADEDVDRLAKQLQEPDFNLNEISFKEEEHYTQAATEPTIQEEVASSATPSNNMAHSGGRTSSGLDEENDSDYKPTQPKARRPQPDSNNCNYAPKSAQSRVAKRGSPKTSTTHNWKDNHHVLATLHSKRQNSDNSAAPRPFSCPLAPYGCHTTFTSKNEWKRHITSRHLRLGFWRCDLCTEYDTRPNDFNRRDLFTQHLRRMHHPRRAEIDNGIAQSTKGGIKKVAAAAASKKGKAERRNSSQGDASDDPFEATLPEIWTRCWVPIRDPPKTAFCVFCESHFDGDNSFNDWLEHTGKHLADLAKQRPHSEVEADKIAEKWQNDTVLRDWLVDQGFVQLDREDGTFNMVHATASLDMTL